MEPTLDVAGDSFANESECEDEVDFVPSPWGWLFPQKRGYVAQSEAIFSSRLPVIMILFLFV